MQRQGLPALPLLLSTLSLALFTLPWGVGQATMQPTAARDETRDWRLRDPSLKTPVSL